MQNRLAGMNANCAVRTPITQRITLLIPATTRPLQSFRPTRTVDSTVKQQDK